MPRDINGLVRWGARTLADAGVGSPRVDAELLLAHVLGVDAGEVRRRVILGTPVRYDARSRFADVVARRAAREPLQHLTGVAPFRHLELAVGPGVFVPRPETERVAQRAIDEALGVVRAPEPRGPRSPETSGEDADTGTRGSRPVVVDLCTGSGAIALAVATEVPGSRVYAVELDAAAHEWAARNIGAVGAAHGSAELVRLVRGDARTALGELDGGVDVVVSNPPYVPPGAVPRDAEVAEHDPAVALYGLGADGLEVPRGIVAAAARLLRPGGLFVMEHAEVQAAAARAMVDRTGAFEPAVTAEDLTGRPRMVVARRTSRDESASGS
nr:peptide chain release factor N(5)-glutamine methyltransferase [Myceligenerans xiligouense]